MRCKEYVVPYLLSTAVKLSFVHDNVMKAINDLDAA